MIRATIISTIIAIPLLLVITGRSVKLTCERVEPHYITCHKSNQYLHGLWSHSTPPFRAKKALVEETYHTDDDGNNYTNYTLYIWTGKEQIDFYFYGKNKKAVELDKTKINQLINTIEKEKETETLYRSYIWIDLPLLFWAGIIIIFCAAPILNKYF